MRKRVSRGTQTNDLGRGARSGRAHCERNKRLWRPYCKDSEREEAEVVMHRLEGLNGRGRTGFGAQTDFAH